MLSPCKRDGILATPRVGSAAPSPGGGSFLAPYPVRRRRGPKKHQQNSPKVRLTALTFDRPAVDARRTVVCAKRPLD